MDDLNAFSKHVSKHLEGDPVSTGSIDPICGMTVDSQKAKAQRSFKNKTFYFCATKCAEKFDLDPDFFSNRVPPPPKKKNAKNQSGQYTCPMHPEIISQGPTDCPLCGMALEPLGVPATTSESHAQPSAPRRSGSAST